MVNLTKDLNKELFKGFKEVNGFKDWFIGTPWQALYAYDIILSMEMIKWIKNYPYMIYI